MLMHSEDQDSLLMHNSKLNIHNRLGGERANIKSAWKLILVSQVNLLLTRPFIAK